MHNPTLRVISVLDAISNSDNGLSLSELSKKLNIPLGTISPIIKTLLHNRLLELDNNTNKYFIGIKAYFIGSSFSSKNSALEIIREELKLLSLESGETCQVGMLKQDKIFYILKIEGKESIRVVSEVGGHLPAHATALGKALLATLNEEELAKVLSINNLEPLTESTITSIDILKKQIKDIKSTGFAFEKGESNNNTACIAVPILQNNKYVAAVSVAYPIFLETEEKKEEIKQLLFKYKKNIEKILFNHNLF